MFENVRDFMHGTPICRDRYRKVSVTISRYSRKVKKKKKKKKKETKKKTAFLDMMGHVTFFFFFFFFYKFRYSDSRTYAFQWLRLRLFSYLNITCICDMYEIKLKEWLNQRLRFVQVEVGRRVKYQLSQFSYLAVVFVVEWEALKQGCGPPI